MTQQSTKEPRSMSYAELHHPSQWYYQGTKVRVTDKDNKIYIATKSGWIEEERKECEE